MKTLTVLLVSATAGGLAWYGLAPESTPTTQPVVARTLVTPSYPEPVKEEPFPQLLQPGPPTPFDPMRPLMVRVPPGYDGIPPSDYYLQPNGAGLWMGGGIRGGFSLAAIQSILPTGPVTSLTLVYDLPGYHATANGQLEPNAFTDQHLIAADGSWRPFEPATRVPGWFVRFPNATGPFVVFQP